MSAALHLAYRPKTLEDLVGQPYVKATLTNAIANRQIAPAYLFTGPRGTGKTSTARIFAKSLNCLESNKPTVNPCGQCQSCRSIESSNSLDVSEIDAASHNGVDDARELVERSSFAPVAGRYRIFILDECLTGDSLILTNSGPIRLDDPDITSKSVLSYNEAYQQWEFKPVVRQWVKGYRQTLVIQTENSEIRCTPEHLVRTETGWKRAEILKPGDRILSVQEYPTVKKDFASLNPSDLYVPVDVGNILISQHSTNVVPSIMLSIPTGNSFPLNRTTTSSHPLKAELQNWNLCAHSAPVDVARNLTFPFIFSNMVHPLKESSSTGSITPIGNGMVAEKLVPKSGSKGSNRYHLKAWDASMELCWEMAPLSILTPNPKVLDSIGAMDWYNWLGSSTSARRSPNLHPSLGSSPMVATENNWLLPKLPVILAYERFMLWFDQMAEQSRLIWTGLVESLRRVWHGGTWTTALHASSLKQDVSTSNYTPKGIVSEKTKFWWTGLRHLAIHVSSKQSSESDGSTISLPSQTNPLNDGLQNSTPIQFHQWSTSSELVESIAIGSIEPVYDIEVEDNHNFLANGLLVHNCHQLTTQSQNALLKCIEEPPPHVVFVLCTTEAHKVLPTITSRTQRFEFRALSTQSITTQLRKVAVREEISIGDDALLAIARIVNGGLRDALQLLSQVRLLGEDVTANQVIEMAGGITESEAVNIIEAIAAGNTLQLLQSARVLVDAGKTPTLILNSLLQTFRDLLVLQSAPREQSLLTGVVSYRQLKSLAAKWNFDTLNLILTKLQKAELQLRQSVNAGVWLEVSLLNLMLDTQLQPQSAKLTNTAAALSLNEIWHLAIDTAKPDNRMLLSKATLVELNGSQAVLEVVPSYLKKFEANKEAIARLLKRATRHPQSLTVIVRTPTKINGNRRSNA